MEENIICPKCNSNQITVNQKGFSAGKAVAGSILTGGIGALAGFHGSKDIVITCLKCGYQWNPVKEAQKKESDLNLEKFKKEQKVSIERKKWKKAFYQAYQSHDIVKAEEIYLSREKYNFTIKDINAAYKAYKKADKELIIIQWVAVGLFLLCFIGLIKYFS